MHKLPSPSPIMVACVHIHTHTHSSSPKPGRMAPRIRTPSARGRETALPPHPGVCSCLDSITTLAPLLPTELTLTGIRKKHFVIQQPPLLPYLRKAGGIERLNEGKTELLIHTHSLVTNQQPVSPPQLHEGIYLKDPSFAAQIHFVRNTKSICCSPVMLYQLTS